MNTDLLPYWAFCCSCGYISARFANETSARQQAQIHQSEYHKDRIDHVAKVLPRMCVCGEDPAMPGSEYCESCWTKGYDEFAGELDQHYGRGRNL